MLLRFFLVLCLLSAVAGCGGGGSDSTPPPEIAFTTIDKTSNSGIAMETLTVVRDASAWATLWQQHTSNVSPPTPLPVVDFSTKLVIAVFLGAGTNGCYSVEIQHVYQAGDTANVMFHVRSEPPPGYVCTQNIVYPAHIVSIPSANIQNVQFFKDGEAVALPQ